MSTCFVVQGFGKKTDFTDGRVLDLDASYAVIKEGVEAAGLQCIRADEIQHSGTIDVPMYQQLLQADLVIADLSTYNVNAAFELGVRYDPDVTRQGLDALGLGDIDAAKVQLMDSVKFIPEMQRVGQAYAAAHFDIDTHFKGFIG